MINQEGKEILLIKEKVDEAFEECLKIIAKKAVEAGLEKRPEGTWLFFNRVSAIIYSNLYQPRVEITLTNDSKEKE